MIAAIILALNTLAPGSPFVDQTISDKLRHPLFARFDDKVTPLRSW